MIGFGFNLYVNGTKNQLLGTKKVVRVESTNSDASLRLSVVAPFVMSDEASVLWKCFTIKNRFLEHVLDHNNHFTYVYLKPCFSDFPKRAAISINAGLNSNLHHRLVLGEASLSLTLNLRFSRIYTG